MALTQNYYIIGGIVLLGIMVVRDWYVIEDSPNGGPPKDQDIFTRGSKLGTPQESSRNPQDPMVKFLFCSS